jgi:hypothetical protein
MMRPSISRPHVRHAWLCAAIVLAGGCQSTGSVIERLDESSGLTLATDPVLAVYARTETRLSRSARDYIYLGPVDVNERGRREYYLWVGIASTIDRDFLAGESSTPDVLYIVLDGAPVEFELMPWDQRLPRLGGRRVYDPAVSPGRIMAARVTRDQIQLISDSRPDAVRVARTGEPTVDYFLWGDPVEWRGFVGSSSIGEGDGRRGD